MKLLLLTFYYPPDLSAGSFRAKSLVEALRRQAGGTVDIDVITTSPNRYHAYRPKAAMQEAESGLTITRIPLPSHNSGSLDQSRVFVSFARQVLRETRNKRWDITVATSSRLMTAALGERVAKRSHSKLYLDIRDLFTDTMSDLLSQSPLRHSMPAFRSLERRVFRSADKINFVSRGFAPHGIQVAPNQTFSFFTNGIDDEFLNRDFSSTADNSKKTIILYAGNIGDGQGLQHIIPDASLKLASRAHFKMIGTGGRRSELVSILKTKSITNVVLMDPVPRIDLLAEYRDADILFLHLNDHSAFKKVLPSKIFEYAATGKRILAGVSGYSADFMRNEIEGCEVFSPCNVEQMLAGYDRLSKMPKLIDRSSFKSRFDRKTIMNQMALDILSVASTGPAL